MSLLIPPDLADPVDSRFRRLARKLVSVFKVRINKKVPPGGVASTGAAQVSSCEGVHIPHDIVECVLDCCKDDIRTLSQCALVSREWVFPCQRNLFSRVKVKLSRTGPQPPFLEYLRGPTTLGSHVKTLELQDGECTPDQVLEWINTLLPNLRALHLRGLTVFPSQPSPDNGTYSAPSTPWHLDLLHVSTCQYATMEMLSLLELINLFPSISELHFEYVFNAATGILGRGNKSLPSHLLSQPNTNIRKTRVDKLSFSPDQVPDMELFCRHARNHVDMGCLSELVVFSIIYKRLQSFQELVDAATNLKCLTTGTGNSDRPQPSLSLSLLSSLSTIEFTHSLTRSGYRDDLDGRSFETHLTRATSMISSLCVLPPPTTAGSPPCAPISIVRFKTRVKYRGSFEPEKVFVPVLQREAWSRLDAALDPFVRLQRVEVHLVIFQDTSATPMELVPVPYPEVLDLIPELLVRTARRCVVTAEVVEEVAKPRT